MRYKESEEIVKSYKRRLEKNRKIDLFLNLLFGLFIISFVSYLTYYLLSNPDNPLFSFISSFANAIANPPVHKIGFDSDTYKIEELVFQKVNGERKAAGLKELIWNSLLADIAREHSLDMANQSYFSHENLQGETPAQRAQEKGIDILKMQGSVMQVGVAENIGMTPTGNVEGYGYVTSPEDVANASMNGWMNSPGHRANILNSNYNAIGVGVAYDGAGKYYLTQDFE